MGEMAMKRAAQRARTTREVPTWNNKTHVTVPEAAEMLGVSIRTVERMRATRELVPVRLAGRTIRFRVEDLLRVGR